MECGVEESPNASAGGARALAGIDASLRDEFQWMRCLARISPVAIFRADAEGLCTYANERWTELTGYPQEAALGTGWERAVHPEDLHLIREEWERSKKQM